MIGIRSPNHRFDASDWAFAYAIVLLTIPVCLSLVRLVGIWTCPESHIRTLFRSHAQSCCSGRHVSHQKPIAKRYPSTKSNQHYLETVKKSNAETHCGRKCMFIKNFIPISQYPNIPISQYNFISGYNFPNIPISQYPNLYWDIGISGYPNQEQLFKEARTNTHAKQASCYWALGPYCPPNSAFCLACVFRAPRAPKSMPSRTYCAVDGVGRGPSNKRPARHVFWCAATASRPPQFTWDLKRYPCKSEGKVHLNFHKCR